MVRTGEAQFAHPMPAEQIKVLQNDPKIDILVQPSVIVRYLFINNLQKPFTDVRVRQAINYAINKEALAKLEVLKRMAAALPSAYAVKLENIF